MCYIGIRGDSEDRIGWLTGGRYKVQQNVPVDLELTSCGCEMSIGEVSLSMPQNVSKESSIVEPSSSFQSARLITCSKSDNSSFVIGYRAQVDHPFTGTSHSEQEF